MKLRVGFALLLAFVAVVPVVVIVVFGSREVEARGIAHARDRVDHEASAASQDALQTERALGESLRSLAASLARDAPLTGQVADWARTSMLPLYGVYSRDGSWIGGWPELPRIEARQLDALDGHCVGVPVGAERPLEGSYFTCFRALSGGELVYLGVPFEQMIAPRGDRERTDVDLVVTAPREVSDLRERRVVRAVPALHGGLFAELVAVAAHAREDQIAGELRSWGARLILGVAILAALLGLMLGARADRTLVELESAAARIGRGDLEVTLGPGRSGASETYSAFNRMARELQQAQLRAKRAERVAAWRDIAQRIAHEIKNPLMPIRVSMETLRRTKQRQHPEFDEIFDESTATVLEEVARLERIVSEFSRFARLPRPRPVSLDVQDAISQVISLHVVKDLNEGATIEVKCGEPLPEIRADRDQLVQVLLNLVQNARDAAESRHGALGHVQVLAEKTSEGGVRVTVGDNGRGIPDEERARILEPYYTTKAGGTGLGLAIVDRIVSEHGGVLEIGSSALGGAAITIVLTREGPADEPEASRTY